MNNNIKEALKMEYITIMVIVFAVLIGRLAYNTYEIKNPIPISRPYIYLNGVPLTDSTAISNSDSAMSTWPCYTIVWRINEE